MPKQEGGGGRYTKCANNLWQFTVFVNSSTLYSKRDTKTLHWNPKAIVQKSYILRKGQQQGYPRVFVLQCPPPSTVLYSSTNATIDDSKIDWHSIWFALKCKKYHFYTQPFHIFVGLDSFLTSNRPNASKKHSRLIAIWEPQHPQLRQCRIRLSPFSCYQRFL